MKPDRAEYEWQTGLRENGAIRLLNNYIILLVAMRTGGTPVPIPNTTVKTCAADGTTLETAWESRWLPASFSKQIRRFSRRCRFLNHQRSAWPDKGQIRTLKTAQTYIQA